MAAAAVTTEAVAVPAKQENCWGSFLSHRPTCNAKVTITKGQKGKKANY